MRGGGDSAILTNQGESHYVLEMSDAFEKGSPIINTHHKDEKDALEKGKPIIDYTPRDEKEVFEKGKPIIDYTPPR